MLAQITNQLSRSAGSDIALCHGIVARPPLPVPLGHLCLPGILHMLGRFKVQHITPHQAANAKFFAGEWGVLEPTRKTYATHQESPL